MGTSRPTPGLRLHDPGPAGPPGPHPTFLVCDVWRAHVVAWTPEEWDALEDRPPDALPCPNGVRVAVRMG